MSDDTSVYEDAYSIMYAKAMPMKVIQNGNPNLRKLAYNAPTRSRDVVIPEEPKPEVPQKSFTPSEIYFKLHQANLQSKLPTPNPDITPQKQPIYYKPPSLTKGTQFGIQEFLPPSVSSGRTNKIPLERSKIQSTKATEEVTASEVPTGEWTNPIMTQALSRQINITFHIKKCFSTSLLILLSLLVRSGISKVAFLRENQWYAYLSWGVGTTLALNFLASLYYVVRGQDQCNDLPLSNKQRELIGLTVVVDEDEDTKLLMKERQYELNHEVEKIPRYSKIANLGRDGDISGGGPGNIGVVSRLHGAGPDGAGRTIFNESRLVEPRFTGAGSRLSPSISLSSSSAPLASQFLSAKPQTREVSDKVRQAFEHNFNIDFEAT